MTCRYFALVPAAGISSRMGQPKLLLPLHSKPLIGHTLAAWQSSRVNKIVVVVRGDDDELARCVQNAGAELVRPALPPPDMKASLQAALRHIAQVDSPTDADAFLVAPADMPLLVPAIINRLLDQHAAGTRDAILAPSIAGKRGHPVLFCWPLAAEVHALAADQGLDTIVRRTPPRLVPCDDILPPGSSPFADIDTPADYDRLNAEGPA